MDDTFVYNKFWEVLLRIGKERRGWLSDTTEVLDKKNIDPANYSITYRYAFNVPMQGDAYGDCGIWVIRNMY
nr:ulp1 protease family, C-terminal catalytic domain-containing protein [Tanacetum cinerariifolium]